MTTLQTDQVTLGRTTCPCWTCRYDLSGLPDEHACPECRTAVFRYPVHQTERWRRSASTTLGMGLLAVIVTCMIGPLAVGLATAAIVRSQETKRDLALAGVWPRPIRPAQIGGLLGWLAAALQAAMVVAAAVYLMNAFAR